MNHKQAVERFLELWKNRSWAKLMKSLTITWIKTHSRNVKKDMRKTFQNTRVTDYEITGEKRIGECIYDITARIVRKNGQRGVIIIRVICETELYKLSTEGTWGVNPVSCLRFKSNQYKDTPVK